jgi:hypothetical protein
MRTGIHGLCYARYDGAFNVSCVMKAHKRNEVMLVMNMLKYI